MDTQIPLPYRRKVFFLRLSVLFLSLAVLVLLFLLMQPARQSDDFSAAAAQKADIPYQNEIKKIIGQLGYSGVEDFMRPEVSLTVDFASRTWSMRNIHSFDDAGNITLAKGRFGLCGDLAAHTYQKLKSVLPDTYRVEFVRASQSGYFLGPDASHIILFIFKPRMFGEDLYILDPAFRKYGSEDAFDDYLFLERMNQLRFVVDRNPDESFKAGRAMPLVIKKDFLISVLVDEQEGRFDRDNFILTLAATRRFKFAGRYILAFRKVNGQTDIMENTYLAHRLLSKDEYAALKKRLTEFFTALQ